MTQAAAHTAHARPEPARSPHAEPARRSLRVTLLAAAMILMGLADLQLTLTYMRSTGLIELNPIARAMIEIGGARQLVMYKLLSIAMSAGVLYILRRHALAERCAWVSCVLLLALTAHWVRYNDAAIESPAAAVALTAAPDHRWVTLPD